MFEDLLSTLCPQCADAVRSVVKRVQEAAAAEVRAKHEANKAAAEAQVQTVAEAVAVLKGKK